MKKKRAMEIMYPQSSGYMIIFDRERETFSTYFDDDDNRFVSDHWPDIRVGDKLIPDLKTADKYANRFAQMTIGKYYNIRIVDHKFRSIDGIIRNIQSTPPTIKDFPNTGAINIINNTVTKTN